MKAPKKTSTALNRAADLLESGKLGWIRGDWVKPAAKDDDAVCYVCAEGAIQYVCGRRPNPHKAWDKSAADKFIVRGDLYIGRKGLKGRFKNTRIGKYIAKRGYFSMQSFNDLDSKQGGAASMKDVVRVLRLGATEAAAQGD